MWASGPRKFQRRKNQKSFPTDFCISWSWNEEESDGFHLRSESLILPRFAWEPWVAPFPVEGITMSWLVSGDQWHFFVQWNDLVFSCQITWLKGATSRHCPWSEFIALWTVLCTTYRTPGDKPTRIMPGRLNWSIFPRRASTPKSWYTLLSIDWLIGWKSTGRLIDWLKKYWLIDWLIDCWKPIDWVISNFIIVFFRILQEGLKMGPGMSFLNIGSGTGYLNTLAGLLIGTNRSINKKNTRTAEYFRDFLSFFCGFWEPFSKLDIYVGSSGSNHGIELHASNVQYAEERHRDFMRQSVALRYFDYVPPTFLVGNALNCLGRGFLNRYDRIYVGAACDEPANVKYFLNFLKVGGLMVIPTDDQVRGRFFLLLQPNFAMRFFPTQFQSPIIFWIFSKKFQFFFSKIFYSIFSKFLNNFFKNFFPWKNQWKLSIFNGFFSKFFFHFFKIFSMKNLMRMSIFDEFF